MHPGIGAHLVKPLQIVKGVENLIIGGDKSMKMSYILETIEICLGSTKMEIPKFLWGKSISHQPGKNLE